MSAADNDPEVYGIDLDCVDDVDETGRLKTGPDLIAQDVYHRLTTKKLIDNDDFGIDVRTYIGGGYDEETISSIQPEIDEVVQRDKRVASSVTTATLVSGEGTNDIKIVLSIEIEVDGGVTFTMVVKVSALTVELLEGKE